MSPTARRIGLIAVVGLATGVLTQLGQGLIPDGWNQAANSISPWLTVAFLLASSMPDRRWAAAAGVGTLALAVIGYYAMIQLRYGYGASTGALIFWGIGSLAGGVVYGLAGRAWRTGGPRQRAAAIGLLAAVYIAEGIYLLNILPRTPAVGAGFVIVGLVVPLLVGRTRADRLGGYVAIAPMLLLGLLGYVAFIAVYFLTTGLGV